MKRWMIAIALTAASLLSASLLSASAQDKKEWDSFSIAGKWYKQEISVPGVKGKLSLADFAIAFANEFPGNILWDSVKNYLTVDGYAGEDVDSFVLDRRAGYLSIRFRSDATRAGEMCYWNVKNGKQRFAINVADFCDDGMSRLYIYEYDPAKGALIPCAEEPVGLNYGNVNEFKLPREGKDIEVVMELGPNEWVRFDEQTGVFTFEPTAPAAVACFINDESATNVRNAPGGKVIGQIPNGGTYGLSVCNPRNGWWQILHGVVYEEVEGDVIEFEGEAWIHNSVLGISTRNYGGQTLNLYAEPREDAAVSGRITKQEVIVRPLDMTEDADWVKVSWNGQTGWIDSVWMCASTLTTCP